jgi:pyruvate carboxylase subunit B
VKAAGKHAQLCICYSVTEEGCLGGDIYNLDYYLQKARIMEEMGADSICIKDMAGLLSPYDAFTLIEALKRQVKVPIQLHTHYTSGMASMTVLKAAEAGVDIVDASLSPLALRTSQPAVEPLVVTLRGTPRDTGLDLKQLSELGAYFETLAPYLRQHMSDGRLAVVDTGVLIHQIPGGMYSNLISQLREAEALDRLPEVLEELPRTRKELGYPPLVTPTSQIVGVQAVNNVLFGRWNVISGQVKDYAYGLYGAPPAPVDPDVIKKALEGYERGSVPITGRPGDTLEPELKRAEEATKDLAKDIGDVLVYALYPVTGLQFLKVKYGLEKRPEAAKPPAPAPAAAPAEAPPLSARARSFNVAVSGRFFQVTVDPVGSGSRGTAATPVGSATPQAASVAAAAPAAAPAVAEGESAITAPMPGIVVRYTVEVGQEVKSGDTVVILEAMKMENALPAPADGVVKLLPHQSGAKVARGDVLAVIAAS